MNVEKIEAVLAETKAKLAVILCHQSADPDAIGSVFAFSQLLKKIQPNLEIQIVLAQGVSKTSKDILKVIPMETTSSPRVEEVDIVFLLDTSTLQQLGQWKAWVESTEKPVIVIDHHAVHPKTKELAMLTLISEDATSTCEIVYEMFKQAEISPSKETAQALFLGIAFDTKYFTIADSATFKTVAELIEFGVDAREALRLLIAPMEASERISRLKAAKRLKLVRVGEWLITISHVSSHQSSAARALLGLGAHVAVVCGEKEGEFRINMRSSEEFYRKTRVHLGRDIAQPLGEFIKGMGGGHSTAAGVNGVEGDFNRVSVKCITLLREKLKELSV